MVSGLKRFQPKAEIVPFWISAIYMIISCLWIGFSDIFMVNLVSYSSEAFIWLGIVKAWLFVAATSLALFILLRRYVFAVQNTQRRLALSEERYHRFFEYTHDPILLFDRQGRCIDANPQTETLTGFPREKLLHRHISKLIPQQSSEEISGLFKNVQKRGFIQSETTITHQDGTPRWVEYTLAHHTGGYYPMILRDITAQKNHLETLQRAALIFQHLTVGILVTDEAGHITDINPAAEKMFGYSKAEMMGQSTGVLYDLQLRKSREAIMAGLQKTGYWHGEIQFMRKNNQIGVCDRVVVPLLDQHNRMIGRISINQDITDCKKAETELREKNAQMEAVFRAMPDLYFRLDATGRLLDIKPNLHIDLPLPLEDMLYNDVHAIFPPRTANKFEQAITQALATKLVTNVEYSFPSNPKIYEARLSALSDYEVVAICRDMTEDKEAEARLKFQRTLLTAISEASLDGIVVGSEAGKCIYYNRNFLKMWSLPGTNLDKADCLKIAEAIYTQVTEPAKCQADFERLMGDRVEVDRYQLQLTDGRVFDRYTAPLVDGQAFYGRVWYYRDLTEQLKLETQLRQSQKMEAIGRLAGGVAHDFNNILTIVIGNLEFLIDRTPNLPEPIQHDLDIVKAAAQRAAKLTAQLLAFSRQQHVRSQPVAVNDLLQALQRLLEGMIGDDITLELSLKANPDQVMFDPNQLEQVLFNLVANARDAMPEGGRITIATDTIHQPSQPGDIMTAAGERVVITVSDTGRGIDTQTQAKMFDPFFTTKSQGKGTGLGLSIVYGIVTQYDGQIEFDSQPTQGTIFKVLLPLVEDIPGSLQQNEIPNQVSKLQGHETIMVVDDDDEVRSLVSKVLKRHGYEVMSARTGVEALTTLASNPVKVDLLIADVMMPELYGPELAARIKAQQPDLKILYLSGFTSKALTRWNLDQNEILIKPFSISTLISKVQELLPPANSSELG
ncbi:MAG: PAS domain S-box protein [Anaerolineaceae bacterium]|nr:PAS domain S-box protein [Anaerolineaceae bacterium]MCB9099084.1 PAS domain S-box protein [Anaerolineales bacterium]